MELINYVLVFKNNKGETVLCKNDGTQVDISEKPFYKSKENAEKAISKIKNAIKAGNKQYRKRWYDKAIAGEIDIQSQGEYKQAMSHINNYENGLLILENGLETREVKMSIDLSVV